MKKTNEVNTQATENNYDVENAVWILIARTKGKDKKIKKFLCRTNEATQEAVGALKDNKMTFITLTTDVRVQSFLDHNPIKGWKSNENALTRKDINPGTVFEDVLYYLNTTPRENWFDEGVDILEVSGEEEDEVEVHSVTNQAAVVTEDDDPDNYPEQDPDEYTDYYTEDEA